MMTLISLAITTAYLYSVGVFFFPPQDAMGMPMDFFWELATLITVMLLGHWIELRSVGQAQGALRELAKLLPDTAERLLPSGETETVEVSQLRAGDRVLYGREIGFSSVREPAFLPMVWWQKARAVSMSR